MHAPAAVSVTQAHTQHAVPLAAPAGREPVAGTPAHAPSETQPFDSVLLGLIQHRDAAAMAMLYDRHSRLVYSVALRVLRDPAAAEDVLQDVFLRIWRKPVAFTSARGNLGAWLAVVARNRAVDLLRQRRPSEPLDDLPLFAPGDLHAEFETTLLAEQVQALIAKLSLVQQQVLNLAYFRGRTHAEIAESIQVPLGTVKTRIRTALLTLREGMQNLTARTSPPPTGLALPPAE